MKLSHVVVEQWYGCKGGKTHIHPTDQTFDPVIMIVEDIVLDRTTALDRLGLWNLALTNTIR